MKRHPYAPYEQDLCINGVEIKPYKHELFINGICLGVTSNCNWNCDRTYCVSKFNSVIDEEDLLRQFSELREYSKPPRWISGGEPGLLSENFWDQFFDMIDWKVMMCTNGTFVERYFPKYKDRVSVLCFHVIEEIDQEINPWMLDAIQKDLGIPYTYNFVLHRNNVQFLDAFLTKYHYLTFNINIADGTSTPWHRDKYDCAMTIDSSREAAMILLKHKKYQNYGTVLLRKALKGTIQHMNSWSEKNVKSNIIIP